ncbi:Uncharacterised protein r2_g3698 [Pycnogonum litorale]
MRIRGRLQLSDLSFQSKHPIILPSCHVCKLLIRFQNLYMKHAGVIHIIHIKDANSLEAGTFIQTLRKFISNIILCTPNELWCDNGTIFIGAKNELDRSLQDWMKTVASSADKLDITVMPIEWKFSPPPTASHMNDVWERMISNVMDSLFGNAGSRITLETLRAVFTAVIT